MTESTPQFVRRRNIERYRRQLSETPDQGQRLLLLDLLAEEEARPAVPLSEDPDRPTARTDKTSRT